MNDYIEKEFDKVLKLACRLYLEEIASMYPDPQDLSGKYKFSANFEKSMEIILRSH